jgi:hypothetical protein
VTAGRAGAPGDPEEAVGSDGEGWVVVVPPVGAAADEVWAVQPPTRAPTPVKSTPRRVTLTRSG